MASKYSLHVDKIKSRIDVFWLIACISRRTLVVEMPLSNMSEIDYPRVQLRGVLGLTLYLEVHLEAKYHAKSDFTRNHTRVTINIPHFRSEQEKK